MYQEKGQILLESSIIYFIWAERDPHVESKSMLSSEKLFYQEKIVIVYWTSISIKQA